LSVELPSIEKSIINSTFLVVNGRLEICDQ
jgi:hypothetical protein